MEHSEVRSDVEQYLFYEFPLIFWSQHVCPNLGLFLGIKKYIREFFSLF